MLNVFSFVRQAARNAFLAGIEDGMREIGCHEIKATDHQASLLKLSGLTPVAALPRPEDVNTKRKAR